MAVLLLSSILSTNEMSLLALTVDVVLQVE
jgi:hypothetical protein